MCGCCSSDRSRLAANAARRTNGNRTDMRRGVYSPCDLCKDDPTAPPAWQLKARQITDDKELKQLEFRDAIMEIDGWPVFYTPYMSAPDPSVKRASGFLIAVLRQLQHPRLPFRDALLPGARTGRGRHPRRRALHQRPGRCWPANTASASATASLRGHRQHQPQQCRQQPSNTADLPDQWRGHIDAHGVWDLDDTYRTGFALPARVGPDLSAALRLQRPAAQRDDQPRLSRRLRPRTARPTSTRISSSR